MIKPGSRFWKKNLNIHSGSSKFSTICGGVSGSDPFYSYQLLDKKLLRYHPDIVILTINHSDIDDVIARGGFERFAADGKIQYASPPAIEWLFAKSHFFRFILMQCLKYDWLLLSPAQKRIKVEKALEKLESLFLKFKDQSINGNFKFLIVFHPFHWELESKRYGSDFRRLQSYAAKNGIQTFDLLSYFLNNEEVRQYDLNALYWPKDKHFTPLGYNCFAKGVEKFLYDAFFYRTAANLRRVKDV